MSASLPWLLLLVGVVLDGRLVVEVAFEGVETVGPSPPVGLEPGIDLCQRLGAHPVPPSLCLAAHRHQTGVAQHPQVLRDPGLAEPEVVDQVADRPLPRMQQIEDPPPGGLGTVS
jgi:hypothetical protein